ncbi:hypothetical protein LTR16_003563 [Cryomyces antarcticus]|uniref:Uncharacterized protein n=1 Tax=Cryomyces antarcticus TaxID=329879 RepID=A0ABR0KSD7_9PEZI|nr:hypothetical protein LTR60_002203 [Cryomyces antarcticus]KAK5124335.1 hypothetical protein LTR16_003563 [Cryomyces antarcticus]
MTTHKAEYSGPRPKQSTTASQRRHPQSHFAARLSRYVPACEAVNFTCELRTRALVLLAAQLQAEHDSTRDAEENVEKAECRAVFANAQEAR